MGWKDHMAIRCWPIQLNEGIELIAWTTKNEPKNSPEDANDDAIIIVVIFLCVGMVHVLGERNKERSIYALCLERGIMNLFMIMNLCVIELFTQKGFLKPHSLSTWLTF